MIRRPGHLANTAFAAGSLPEVPGLDVQLAARNVGRGGGDPRRFADALAAAIATSAGEVDPVTLAGIAAWRAGALAFREDALERADRLASDRTGWDAAAAALQLDPGDLGTFLTRQRTDRFWWPGREASRGYVCAVGGFAGIGGAFVSPPTMGAVLAAPGAFAIRTGERWWRLDADVWGSRLAPLDQAPDEAESDVEGEDGVFSVSIVCVPDSYLAWVFVTEPA